MTTGSEPHFKISTDGIVFFESYPNEKRPMEARNLNLAELRAWEQLNVRCGLDKLSYQEHVGHYFYRLRN